LKGALSTLAAKRATTTAADLEELGKSGVLNSAGTSLSRLVAEIEEALVSLDAISRERP